MGRAIKSVMDLTVYRSAFELAMEIFEITKKFPKEEVYALTDQIRRSTRSVSVNIREGFAKRRYQQTFIRHLNDALGSSEESRGWLEFALSCAYIPHERFQHLDSRYDELSAMLYSLMNKWKSF